MAESHNEKSTRILKHKIYFKGGNSEAANNGVLKVTGLFSSGTCNC